MISGIFHQGSGLGNQLFRYVTTRVLAADKGFEWGMFYNQDNSGKQEGFKGTFFTEQPLIYSYEQQPIWYEKKILDSNGVDIRGYDPEINFVEDNIVIDGEFQDPRYWSHRMEDIDKWLSVEPVIVPNDLCIIGFRGGEYASVPDLFLPKQYWDEGIEKMRKINPNMRFEVHTDDAVTAQQFFPDYKIVQDMEMNWRTMRYARHAIIANSSFYIFPRLLYHIDHKAVTIAPKYWARHNTKIWALPQNYYSKFTYL